MSPLKHYFYKNAHVKAVIFSPPFHPEGLVPFNFFIFLNAMIPLLVNTVLQFHWITVIMMMRRRSDVSPPAKKRTSSRNRAPGAASKAISFLTLKMFSDLEPLPVTVRSLLFGPKLCPPPPPPPTHTHTSWNFNLFNQRSCKTFFKPVWHL